MDEVKKLMRALEVCLLTLLLAACGGGGGGGAPDSDGVGDASSSDSSISGSSSSSSNSSSNSSSSSSSSANSDDSSSRSSSSSDGVVFHTVTTSVGEGINVEPSEATVEAGGTISFQISSNEAGYAVNGITGCDGSYDQSGSTYTTAPVTGNCTVSVTSRIAVNLEPLTISAQPPSIVTMVQRVTDRVTGDPVTQLTLDDFQILEDGQEIAKREAFLDLEPIENLPYQLKTVLMLDVSSSLTVDDIEKVRSAARTAVEQLIENQQVAIYVFDDSVRQVMDFSSNEEALKNAIDGIELGGNSTNLYGAVANGFNLWSDTFSLSQVTQGAMILVTDGNDTSGLSTLEAALAARGEKELFAITVGSDINPDPLVQLVLGEELESIAEVDRVRAEKRLSNIEDYSGLAEEFQRIGEEVERLTQGLYFLYYATPKRGGTHDVSISVSENSACLDGDSSSCVTELTGRFSADGFSNVTPELIVDAPSRMVMPGEDYELSARVRWANPPFSFLWALDNVDGNMALSVDSTDSGQASLTVDPVTQFTLGTVSLEVMEYTELAWQREYAAGVPLRDAGDLIHSERIQLWASPTKELTVDYACSQCAWSVDAPFVVSVGNAEGFERVYGQEKTINRETGVRIVKLTVSDQARGLSTEYELYPAFNLGASPEGKLAASPVHSLAIQGNGSLWAWGDNRKGQLGLSEAVTVDFQYTPMQVGADTDWMSVAAGSHASYAIKNDGSLWAWGDGGALGLGSIDDQAAPTRVGASNEWTQIAAGNQYVLAMKSDGSLWGWGANFSGQLGVGDTVGRRSPVQVGTDNNWASVAVGPLHSLALKDDGSLWAWGSNSIGQLGLGEFGGSRSTPIQVGEDTDWQLISAGSFHSLGIKSDGSLWAWGRTNYGTPGDTTTPVQVGEDNDWKTAVAGSGYSLAVKEDGSLWAWGSNSHYQLGFGSTGGSRSLRRVGTSYDWLGVVTSSDAASESIRTFGIDAEGFLWLWGGNSHGQLGLGEGVTEQSSPAPLMLPAE